MPSRPFRPGARTLSFKSPLEYNFRNVVATTVGGSQDYQSAKLAQPWRVQWGVAAEVTPELLLVADAVWKNWSNSSLYKDGWKDQFLGLLGAQYSLDQWQFRAGYSYATNILKDNPNGTIAGLQGLGTLPLDTSVPGVLNRNDLVRVVQTTLIPAIWQNTLTAGLGYAFTPKVRLDLFGAYAFQGDATRSTLALGTYSVEASEWALGGGVNFKFRSHRAARSRAATRIPHPISTWNTPMSKLKVVVVSGNLGSPSKTLALAEQILDAVRRLTALEAEIHTLAELAPVFGPVRHPGELSEAGHGMLRSIAAADLLIAVTPVYKGAYTGLFKHLFDFLDPKALADVPVILGATGGGDKHALIIEHQPGRVGMYSCPPISTVAVGNAPLLPTLPG